MFDKETIKHLLPLVASFVVIISGISKIIGIVPQYPIYIFVISILLIFGYLFYIITSKKKVSFKTDPVGSYSKLEYRYILKQRNLAKLVSILVLCLGVTFVSIQLFNNNQEPKLNCISNQKHTSILITQFFSGEISGSFSELVIAELDKEIAGIDSISAKGLKLHLKRSTEQKDSVLSNIRKRNCMVKGMTVYGSYVPDLDLFVCNFNLVNFFQDNNLKIDTTALLIKNIDLDGYKLTIPRKAGVLANFILGLIYTNNFEYNLAIDAFNNILKSENSKLVMFDKEFIAINNFYLGINHFRIGNFQDASFNFNIASKYIEEGYYNYMKVENINKIIYDANPNYSLFNTDTSTHVGNTSLKENSLTNNISSETMTDTVFKLYRFSAAPYMLYSSSINGNYYAPPTYKTFNSFRVGYVNAIKYNFKAKNIPQNGKSVVLRLIGPEGKIRIKKIFNLCCLNKTHCPVYRKCKGNNVNIIEQSGELLHNVFSESQKKIDTYIVRYIEVNSKKWGTGIYKLNLYVSNSKQGYIEDTVRPYATDSFILIPK